MSGFIEFCVELRSVSEGAAAGETDGEVSVSQQSSGQDSSNKNGRGGRRGMLRRQSSVVCSRVHSLNTISYVDNGELMIAFTVVVLAHLQYNLTERATSVPRPWQVVLRSAEVNALNICPFLSFRKRNQTLEAEKSLVLLHPTSICTHILCCASDRESGAGLNSLTSPVPSNTKTKPEHFPLQLKEKTWYKLETFNR